MKTYSTPARCWHLISRLIGIVALYTLASTAVVASEYAGADSCNKCHKLIKLTDYDTSSHGQLFTKAPRNAREARSCEACHGPGARHIEVAGEDDSGDLAIPSFKPTPANTAWINASCQGCHQGGMHVEHWEGSKHQTSGLACTSCHRMHDRSQKVAQSVCEGCHVKERAKMQRSAHMPVRNGLMSCTSCHNAHGSSGDGALKTANTNDTCFQCHSDKRGPFLWEHSPVRENCSNCHDPHGSNHEGMLKMRQPYLCQSCHIAASPAPHTSNLYDGRKPVPRAQLATGCNNCHTSVHGSNHPSGNTFQR